MVKAKGKIDYLLFGIVAILLLFGLIALSSASTVVSFKLFHTNTYYFLHQLEFGAIIGLVMMYILSKIDYHVWQKFTPILILMTIFLLLAVLVPHVGLKVGGSRRWISLGPIFLQPAEIAKLTLIFYIASWIDKRSHEIKDFYYGLIPSLLIIFTIAGLIILEPDIGTMLVVITTAMVMLFIGGSRIKHLAWIIFIGIIGLAILVKLEPYRIARFTAFLNPSADPKGIGYQINQALVAIGSGGLFGYGYGRSRQKYNYLPEPISDSIFAIIVEELGFVRASLLVLFYLFLALRGIKIAQGAKDTFGKMVAVGIITWISFQAIVNIGAIMGMFPLTGIPLPFVSYGSSALIVNLSAMGILLNISKHSTI